MPDLDRVIETTECYRNGHIEWAQAYTILQQLGVADYIIREALGDEPEEI
jgi:hypothetical protein